MKTSCKDAGVKYSNWKFLRIWLHLNSKIYFWGLNIHPRLPRLSTNRNSIVYQFTDLSRILKASSDTDSNFMLDLLLFWKKIVFITLYPIFIWVFVYFWISVQNFLENSRTKISCWNVYRKSIPFCFNIHTLCTLNRTMLCSCAMQKSRRLWKVAWF